jgi:mono/diheme cytochrome c family protein
MASFKQAVLAAGVLAAAGTAASFAAEIRIPNGPGSNVVYSKCQACHDLQYVVDAKGLLPAQWNAVVASMQDYGLEITDQEKTEVIKYLTTYLGPKPPPAEPAASGAPAATASTVNGKSVWKQNCATCHGAQGEGQAGYFPPLAGNSDLFGAQLFPVDVVLHGLSGPITVKGKSYNGSMPSFGHLSDAEIASVVNYVRGAWGDQAGAGRMKPVTEEQVAQRRKASKSPQDVHALREKMLSK